MDIRPLLGYDIFISYNRRDAIKYAQELCIKLEAAPYRLTCFLDENEIDAGAPLTQSLKRALKRSRMLLIVCTPNAIVSQHVVDEVLEFQKYPRRRTFLVNINDALSKIAEPQGTVWEPYTSNSRLWESESDRAIVEAIPSERVTRRIRTTFNLVRRRVIANYAMATFIAVSALAVGATTYARVKIPVLKLQAESLRQSNVREQQQVDIKTRQAAEADRKSMAAERARSAAQEGARTANAQAVASNQSSLGAMAVTLAQNPEATDEPGALATALKACEPSAVQGLPLPNEAYRGLTSAVEAALVSYPLRGHRLGVTCASYAPNGRYIVTGSQDGAVYIWDSRNNSQTHRLPVQRNCVGALAISADSRLLATSSFSRQYRPGPVDTGDIGDTCLWDLNSGRLIRRIAGVHKLTGRSFSPDGSYIVTVDPSGASVWSIRDRKEPQVLKGHRFGVTFAEYSPDGRFIATAAEDEQAIVWQQSDLSKPVAILPHPGEVRTARFSPDSKFLLTTCKDYKCRLWDLRNNQDLYAVTAWEKPDFTFPDFTGVTDAQFSPDGKQFLTIGSDLTVRLFQSSDGRPIDVIRHDKAVSQAEFSPDSNTVATSSDVLRVWKKPSNVVVMKRHRDFVRTVQFSPDGHNILSGSDDGTARVWGLPADLSTETCHVRGSRFAFSRASSRVVTYSTSGDLELWRLSDGVLVHVEALAKDLDVNSVTFTGDGKQLLTCGTPIDAGNTRNSRGNAVCLWNAVTGKRIGVYRVPGTSAAYASISPDASRVATVGGGEVGKTKGTRAWICSAHDGRRMVELHGTPVQNAPLTFSPDGRLLVTLGREHEVLLWSVSTGHCLKKLTTKPAAAVNAQFSPSGRVLLTISGDYSAALWDVESGRRLSSLPGHQSSIDAAAFSMDSSRVVTASLDNTARVWDVQTGKLVTVTVGHTGPVQAVIFSPDGQRIATASTDGTARLWDSGTGQPLSVLYGHDDWVNDVAFLNDGSKLITSGVDSTLKVFDTRWSFYWLRARALLNIGEDKQQ